MARMRPPEWPAFPAAERFANLYRAAPSSAIEAVRVQRPRDGADAPRRAASTSNACRCSTSARKARPTSSATARSAPIRCRSPRWAAPCSTGMASAGVVGIIKHMPGHGRALGRQPQGAAGRRPPSAEELEIDLEPFERLASAPMGMTAHVVYTAWDAERPASLSPDHDRTTSSAGGSASTAC